MFKFVVILLVIFVSQCDTLCEPQGTDTYCSSVDDVTKIKQQFWKYITINSKEKQRINGNSFVTIPYVQKLLFRNAVKDIEEFSFNGLSFLKVVFFVNCDLPIVKKNWFSDLSSISFLVFKNSNVRSLEARCFEGSTNLTDVSIQDNNISRIPVNVFSGTSIVRLDLKWNQIQFIQENAFINMPKLKELSLNGNFLRSFNPKLFMGDGGVSNLQYLDLQFNNITNIDKGALYGLTNLVLLDVSCNKLESFPESAFPYTGLPSLKKLFLGNNRLNYMSRSFIRYFPKLEKIDIFGNPWQCSCYKDIINSNLYHNITIILAEEYLNGTRPVCVVPQTGNDTCVDNIQLTNDLYDYYIQDIYPCSNSRFFLK